MPPLEEWRECGWWRVVRINTVAKTVTRVAGVAGCPGGLAAAALSPFFFASLALEALAVVTREREREREKQRLFRAANSCLCGRKLVSV